ncbi:unnamed protein product [Symbiodinium necroappetens]|uniref:Uncharacterized protein n=1 Tax=Symbiodinium necroappetens TaxID=1628268 RepID=A0A812ZQY8_9DINO|nr:unnamed protein product [Symbiodinium necroappetens]
MSGRFSKKTVVRPLRHTVQKRGAPGGAETFREIMPLMTRHIESGSVVAASDSGSGLTKAWQALGVPAAQARHGLDEMTPTVSFPSACLSNKQARTVRKAAAVKKKPAAQFSPKKKSFRIVGGDNQCESQIAVGKNQLRDSCITLASVVSWTHCAPTARIVPAKSAAAPRTSQMC